MAKSGYVIQAGVWWDLHSCPVPDGVDPRCVRGYIESALEKEIIDVCAISIYAMGNLEYMPSDLLENISSSGIVLIHAPCRGNDFGRFLYQWCEDDPEPNPNDYILLISGDCTMTDPWRFQFRPYNHMVAYPKDCRPYTLDLVKDEIVFANEFVWETFFTPEKIPIKEDKPLCICDSCNAAYEICADFIAHLKSEEHRLKLFGWAPRDQSDNPRYFCPVCKYPAYDEFNLILHNESDQHNRKLAEQDPQEEDCQSRKRKWDSSTGET